MPHRDNLAREPNTRAHAQTPKGDMPLDGLVGGHAAPSVQDPGTHLAAVRDAFVAQMLVGLGFGPAGAPSSIRALPTYVTALPTGAERGSFLVADLGGTNLRVGTVDLHGGTYTVAQDVMAVPQDVSDQPDGDVLFDYVADALLRHAGSGDARPLGFTFSYPVAQSSLRSGTLVAFSKGIRCESAVGRDVAEMLEHALQRRMMHARLARLGTLGVDNAPLPATAVERKDSPMDSATVERKDSHTRSTAESKEPSIVTATHGRDVPIHTAALLNDTVGTLLAHRYRVGAACRAGVILGTGTNAAVVAPRVPKLASGPMVVNLEWGAFGDADDLAGLEPGECAGPLGPCVAGASGLRYAAADVALDRASTNAGRQRLEKMVSGKYVGEVVRVAVTLDAQWAHTAFGAVFAAAAAHALDALDVERIEGAGDADVVGVVRGVLERMAEDESHPALCDDALPAFAEHLRTLCAHVVDRSAGLVGALLAGLSVYFEREDAGGGAVETAVDGSMYAKHKGYRERVVRVLHDLEPATRLRLVLCKDDSIVGAAVAVACALRPL